MVGSFYKDKKDFLIRDDSNGKKKEGAIKAAAEYLNRFGNNAENNLWTGSFKENSFILEKKYYEESIIKKLSLDFLDTKHVEELSQLGDMLKIFRKNCHMINSANEKIEIYSPIDFLKRIIEEGKKSISIQRFKGLGEMNPEELWETTLNPENNTLLKVNYSGNDVDTETTNPGDRDREIFKILMGEDVVPRKDFSFYEPNNKNFPAIKILKLTNVLNETGFIIINILNEILVEKFLLLLYKLIYETFLAKKLIEFLITSDFILQGGFIWIISLSDLRLLLLDYCTLSLFQFIV